MGDWDDEDFDVPVLAPAIKLQTNWDDEVDEVELDVDITAKPSTATLDAKKKKAEQDELVFQTKLKLSMQENETSDERRVRERKQQEEADAMLTNEMFDNMPDSKGGMAGGANGIGATILKTKEEHKIFGKTIAKKLQNSSAFHVTAFYKSLSDVLNSKDMNSKVLDDILAEITKIREKKLLNEVAAAPKVEKKSKKQLKGEIQKHNDIFGGADKFDDIEEKYGGMEDDFM